MRGAAILTAGVFLVKLLGALFKIPLNWIIGEDGMGYYTTAYSFYAPVYSLATAGFPVAVSRLTALCCSQKTIRGDSPDSSGVDSPVSGGGTAGNDGAGVRLRPVCPGHGQRKRPARHAAVGAVGGVQLFVRFLSGLLRRNAEYDSHGGFRNSGSSVPAGAGGFRLPGGCCMQEWRSTAFPEPSSDRRQRPSLRQGRRPFPGRPPEPSAG